MSLYREELIEDARNPKWFGELPDADADLEASNPTCGDELVIHIAFRDQGDTVERATFTGRGCMVTLASASRLLTHIQGLSRRELLEMTEDDALAIFNAPVTPGRLDCALMPYLALRQLTDNRQSFDKASPKRS